MNGIYRSYTSGIHEYICITGITITIGIFIVLMSCVQIQAHLNPLLRLYIYSYSTRETIETRIFQITLLIKIAKREHVVNLLISTIDIYVVFLPVTATNSLIIPIKIFTVSTLYLCITYQLAVRCKQCIISLIKDICVQSGRNHIV